MNKHKSILVLSMILISGVVFSFTLYGILFPEPSISGNFALKHKWSQSFDGEIVEISAISDSMEALIRTTDKLYLVEVKTGDVIWEFRISRQVDPSPALDVNGSVFITDSKMLWALDQESGQVIWNQPLLDTGGRVTYVSEKIVLINETSIDVRAYDSESGNFLWSTLVGRGHVEAYVDDATVYIPDHGIKGVDAANGKILWSTGTNTIGSSEYDDGVVYYVTGDNIVAFDARNNSELWRSNFTFSDVGFPSLHIVQPFMFILDGKSVNLLDKNSGSLIWQIGVSQPANVTVVRDHVYILEGISRAIHAVDIVSGKKIGTLRVSHPQLGFTDSQELFSVGDILLISSDDKLFGYGE